MSKSYVDNMYDRMSAQNYTQYFAKYCKYYLKQQRHQQDMFSF